MKTLEYVHEKSAPKVAQAHKSARRSMSVTSQLIPTQYCKMVTNIGPIRFTCDL